VHAHRRRRIPWGLIVVVLLAATLAGVAAVGLNVFGIGDRAENLARRIELLVDPPPDRPIDEAVLVTPRPSATAVASVPPSPTVSRAPGQTAPPAPTQTPVPPRVAVDIDLLADPGAAFISEADKDLCAVAGTQMVLAMYDKAPLTEAFQEELAGRIDEWESRRDSRNGGWGPSAIVKALEAYGVTGYEVRAYETRQDALVDAARTIKALRAPVVLLTWRGAHTWVMTGFTANADPLVFDDAKVTGTYVLDPWYPRISSIWGPSDPPGGYQDLAEMRRNYLPWARPEGNYPKRDGLFLAVVPTEPLDR
jgi:hypothetical protein